MRVRCHKIVNPATLKVEDRSPWVSVGQEYVVLEVLALAGAYVHLRIHLDSSAPSLWDAAMFETVDRLVPSNWVVDVGRDGQLSMGPSAWAESGFWESYFDGDDEAIAVFERELSQILAES